MGFFSTALGIGGALLGGISDNSANASYENTMQAFLDQIQLLYREDRQRVSDAYGQNRNLLQERQNAVLGDLRLAEGELRGGARSGLRAIQDQSTRSLGNLKAQLAGSGLLGSSTDINLQRAIASDAARASADYLGGVGRDLASLSTTRAGFRSDLMGDIAQNPLGELFAQRGITDNLVNSLMAFRPQAPQGGGASGGGILGGLLGGQIDDAGGIGGILGSLFI